MAMWLLHVTDYFGKEAFTPFLIEFYIRIFSEMDRSSSPFGVDYHSR